MKRILTAVIALSLLSGTAAMAQNSNANRGRQGDRLNSENDKNDKNDKQNDKNDKRSDKDARKDTRESLKGEQAARQRAAATQQKEQAAREATLRSEQAARARAVSAAQSLQAARNRQAPRAPSVALQNSNRDSRNNPAARIAAPRWSRGDKLPSQYRQTQYVVSDWRQHGLRQPPRNYHWVRDDNNDFFLALITTGAISDIVSRRDRDQMWQQRYAHEYTYNDDVYYQQCRTSPDPAGIMIGALIGGLLGNAAGSGGGRGGATIAGVILGGATGAALTRNLDCEDRNYAYKTYYDGFNSGKPNSSYQWRNPSNGHYGSFRVVNYANDPDGFRCANYSQEIFINGRPQEATGRACRQPDGAWAIVS